MCVCPDLSPPKPLDQSKNATCNLFYKERLKGTILGTSQNQETCKEQTSQMFVSQKSTKEQD